jgi:general secretion pathway protein L
MKPIAKFLARVQSIFSWWMDSVARTAADDIERLASPRKVTLIESQDGELFLQTGDEQANPNALLEPGPIASSEPTGLPAAMASAVRDSYVDLTLHPDHCLFRTLELPKRATEFLGGIIHSQLDRLMPWNTSNSAFGWSDPIEVGGDRITVTVAATSRDVVEPLVGTIVGAGARSICVSVTPPEPAAGRIPIWKKRMRGEFQARRIRRLLSAVMITVGFSAIVAAGSWDFVANELGAEQDELTRQIVQAGGTAAKLRHAQLDRGNVGPAIAARKRDAPAAVMVIEALSRILPDRTYVTEFRMEGNKLHLTGVTNDAPSLIEALEKSRRFSHATFFAPTTQSPTDANEHFHIEATIEPASRWRS